MISVCERLHHSLGRRRRFGFPFEEAAIPRDGIYVLFEKGETAHGGDRIVRVGTHTGQRQLCSRLCQHFLLENKDRSIFRKNIGRALLARAGDAFAAQWEFDLMTREARQQYGHLVDRERQSAVEREVTRYIQTNFTFTVLEVPDKADRLRFESKLISTVSLCPDCVPSADWLGSCSPKNKIRESGLWQVNELYKVPLLAEEAHFLATCPRPNPSELP